MIGYLVYTHSVTTHRTLQVRFIFMNATQQVYRSVFITGVSYCRLVYVIHAPPAIELYNSLYHRAKTTPVPWCGVFLRLPSSIKVSTMSTSMGMGLDGRDDSTLGAGGLDFHYPHPYEVEVRAFHYMPGQVCTV